MAEPETLSELRARWELTMKVRTEVPEPGALYVVLQDLRGEWHCHRYWHGNSRWNVSADVQGKTAGEALGALVTYWVEEVLV